MRPLKTFTVRPALPPELSRLEELAYNIWWSWHQDAIELFARIDRDRWNESGHNPVRLLGLVDQARLAELDRDDGYRSQLERVLAEFDAYMRGDRPWFERQARPLAGGVAYF